MKVTATEKPSFEPITFTVTIETEQELADLYARLNCSNAICMENQHTKLPHTGYRIAVLFEFIDKIIESRL